MTWEPGAQYLHLRLPDHEKYRVTPRPPRRKQHSVTNFLARYHATCAVAGVALRVATVGRPGSRRQVRAPTDGWARSGGHRPNRWGRRWNTGPSRREHRDERAGMPGQNRRRCQVRTGWDTGTELAGMPGRNRRGCRDGTGSRPKC